MPRTRRDRRLGLSSSIRARLLTVLAAAALLPVLALAGYTYWSSLGGGDAEARSRLEERASAASTLLEQELLRARAAVQLLAANSMLADSGLPPEVLESQFEAAKALHPQFEDITLVAPDGRVIASSDFAFTGSWPGKPWFSEAVAGRVGLAPAHQAGNPPRMVLAFTSPVLRDGVVVAVVAGQLPVSSLTRALAELSPATDDAEAPSSALLMVDARGQVLGDVIGASELGGPIEDLRTDVLAGSIDSSLWTARPVDGTPWYAVARAEVVSASPLLQYVPIGIAGLLSVGAALAVAFVVSSQLSTHTTGLAERMTQLGEGRLEQRYVYSGIHELDMVTRAFNSMAERLQFSQHDLVRSEARFRAIVGEGADVTWVLDGLSRVAFVSQRVEALLGVEAARLEGVQYLDLVPLADRTRLQRALTGARSGDTMVQHHLNVPGGASAHVESRVTDLTGDAAVGGIVVVSRDISDRSASQAEEAEARAAAEREAEAVVQALRNLRLPVTGIRGFTALLRQSASLAATERQWIDYIDTEAGRLDDGLSALIGRDEIDDSSVAEGPRAEPEPAVQFEPVALPGVIDAALEAARGAAGLEHRLLASVPPALAVLGDRELLADVFARLLSIAVQSSPGGGRVTVHASARGDLAVVEVEDEGVGLSEDDLAIVAGAPSLATAPLNGNGQHAVGGAGLPEDGVARDLEAVRAHITRMHGHIEARNRSTRGSVYTVTLPLAAAIEEAA